MTPEMWQSSRVGSNQGLNPLKIICNHIVFSKLSTDIL